MSKSDEGRERFDLREELAALVVAQRETHVMLERGMRRLWCGVLVLIALVALLLGHEVWAGYQSRRSAPTGPLMRLETIPMPTLTKDGKEAVLPMATPLPELGEVPKVGNYEIGTPTEINPDEKKPAVELQK